MVLAPRDVSCRQLSPSANRVLWPPRGGRDRAGHLVCSQPAVGYAVLRLAAGSVVSRRTIGCLGFIQIQDRIMGDLQSKRWILAKGIAFLIITVVVAVLLLFESPSVRTAVFVVLLVWAACRFYYFLFYVLERYVDQTLRYAGIIALVRTILAKRSSRESNDA